MAEGITKRGNSWRARYRNPETGQQHERSFVKQVDAVKWRRQQLDALDRGRWVDPQAGMPKYNSERTIHAAQALIDMLAEHVALGLTNEWLFEGNAKLPPHQNTVGHRWRTTLSRAGVTDVRLHGLRHFYASGLIASGCDVVAVQRALGHAKSTTILTTYVHLWPSAGSRARDASARLAAEVLGAGECTVRADGGQTASALHVYTLKRNDHAGSQWLLVIAD